MTSTSDNHYVTVLSRHQNPHKTPPFRVTCDVTTSRPTIVDRSAHELEDQGATATGLLVLGRLIDRIAISDFTQRLEGLK